MYAFRSITMCLSVIATVTFVYTGLYAPDGVAQVKSYSNLKEAVSDTELVRTQTKLVHWLDVSYYVFVCTLCIIMYYYVLLCIIM